jgi:hypothetical protein
MKLEDLTIYLPKYLSAESAKALHEELKSFMANSWPNKYYTFGLRYEKVVFQGDGIDNLPFFNYLDRTEKNITCMVISNTCDIELSNRRLLPTFVTYCPIIKLSKYRNILLKHSTDTSQQIEAHIDAIKRQEITSIFYLPSTESTFEDSIVLFDRPSHCPNEHIPRQKLDQHRHFTLSDFGAYLLLLKLSIHFTRIRDEVDRGCTH